MTQHLPPQNWGGVQCHAERGAANGAGRQLVASSPRYLSPALTQ